VTKVPYRSARSPLAAGLARRHAGPRKNMFQAA